MYFLPTPYPGELWYSTLCRYHQRSGNVAEIHSIEELFGCRTHLPTVELPSYLDDILAGTDISPEQIMLEHSIYPYYARFLSVQKKESILQRCRGGALTPTTCGQFQQVLKFCPQCVAEQRETYGEAYWVAYQQVRELTVCPIHNVRLQNSPYPVHSGQNPHFHPLNLSDVPIQNEDKLQFNLSKMIYDCASHPFSFEETPWREPLKLRLVERGYLSLSGQILQNKRLSADLKEAFPDSTLRFDDEKRISHWLTLLFGGRDCPTLPILLLAMFLDLEVEELLTPCCRESLQEGWDSALLRLAPRYNSLRQLAGALHSNSRTVKQACIRLGIQGDWHYNGGGRFLQGNRYGDSPEFEEKRALLRHWWLTLQGQYPGKTHTQLRQMPGIGANYEWLFANDHQWLWEHMPKTVQKRKSVLDFEKLDAENLDLIERCIVSLSEDARPERITRYAVAVKAGIPANRLLQMPRCMAAINAHEQSLDEFRIAKIRWAIHVLERENRPIYRSNLSAAAGVKPKELLRLQSELEELNGMRL
ncbi:MAG: TnsD family Tn7-like transposition protein [Oscillospiraceae bacterium]